jgi:protein-tyrosine-phosphatase
MMAAFEHRRRGGAERRWPPSCGTSTYEDWELDDPADAGLDDVRRIRDEIGARVRQLADELVSAHAS